MTPAGARGLAALCADPAHAVVALDYDGTLAPIVAVPSQAVPAPGAVAALLVLGAQVGTLALVTGRSAQTVVELGGLHEVPGLVVLGQYGTQRWSAGALTSAAALPGVAPVRAALPGLLAGQADLAAGAWVEDKDLALVVHTRACVDPAGALARLTDPVTRLAQEHGLQVHPGRYVLELRPPGFDKGRALLALCDPAPSAVLFAGDDLGDLAGFDAVEQLRAGGVPGLLVCSGSDEGPAALRERADLVVDGPRGVVALLAGLLDG